MELFSTFPYLENELVIIKKMEEKDVTLLSEISNNENVYKFIPPFLYKKNDTFLLTAIKNLGSRDFEKKKWIIAGIFLKENPDKLVGLAEMFDYKKRENKITVGYCINEDFWNQKIATNTLTLMIDYLVHENGIETLKAFVMSANIYSSRTLLNSGFLKEEKLVEKKNWGGQDVVLVEEYTYTQKENSLND